MDNLKLIKIAIADYEALVTAGTVDAKALYFVEDAVNNVTYLFVAGKCYGDHGLSGGGSGTLTDVKVNNTSVVVGDVALLDLSKFGITASVTEINQLQGVTVAPAELNKLSGLTASASDLNKLAGTTVTKDELDILHGVTVDKDDINMLDGITSNVQDQLDDKADAADLTAHTGNATIHVTAQNKTDWNAKQDAVTLGTDSTSTATPGFGGTVDVVSGLTKDSNGHVIKNDVKTITIPSAVATTSSAGLLSATDKAKLDGIAEGADNVLFTQNLAESADNVQIATISINGTSTKIFAPDASSSTYTKATSTKDGLMSKEDKGKLDGIDDGANNYTLPSATGTALGGVKVGSNITNTSGTISLSKDNVTNALGYVPPEDTVASTTANGLMSKTDKTKLDGVETGAQVNTVTGVKGDGESTYRTGNINITKANVGLGNVDNTTDLNKPISTATQAALDLKADDADLTTHVGDTTKHITALERTTWNAKQGAVTLVADTNDTSAPAFGDAVLVIDSATRDANGHVTKINKKAVSFPSNIATSTDSGLMSAVDKAKLDSITSDADNVAFTAALSTGTKVGTISINGTSTDIFAPVAGSASAYDDTQLRADIAATYAPIANVYTRTTTDTKLGTKADVATTYTKDEVDAMIPDITTKADKSTTFTKSEVNTLLATKANSADVYTQTEMDTKLGTKADSSVTYTKTQVDSAVGLKADKSTTYTKTEVDGLLDTKVDPTDVYLKTAMDTKLSSKADTATTYTKTEVDSSLNLKADKTTTYTKTETDDVVATNLASAKSYTDTEINKLVNGAPESMNTIYKLSEAMQESSDLMDALNSAIGTKADTADIVFATSAEIDAIFA